MPILVLSLFRLARLLLSGHVAVAMENAALRVQLVAFKRNWKRPALTSFDRLFWVGLSLLWTGWRAPLVYVRADTVVRWQRERFRRIRARRSRVNQRHRGRPATAVEIRRLIERMVAANPLWRAPRIHGELTMLGIVISERTVSPNPPETAAAARPDLEDVPAQITSVRWFRLNFFTVPTRMAKILDLSEHMRLRIASRLEGISRVHPGYIGLRARYFVVTFALGS